MTTPYQAKYWAHALTLKGPAGDIDSLSRSISNARVDLNPHQVDAALFALRSPLSKGAILADEVGLGKTIEAGLVLSQKWAERRRKLLVIVPATLRAQWEQELDDKFHLPSVVLESRSFNRLRAEGTPNPFERPNQVVLCSYQFAAAKQVEISRVPWDLVVIDEAHRLRNVYRTGNKTARAIAGALEGSDKLLLTATPLQNSLLELYGLVSVVDSRVFGDLGLFREQFTRAGDEARRNTRLRERLAPICSRTLRKQVREYIKFTERVPITQEFLPSDPEHELYEAVSDYLQREVLLALPASQRMLMTMVMRKLLASSSFAIGDTLRKLIRRLELASPADVDLDDEFETLGELQEEWDEAETSDDDAPNPALLREELALLRGFVALADCIPDNAKGQALLKALDAALSKAVMLGARRKAVVFTESRRTQQYLYELLKAAGYGDGVLLMNGTNTDPHSRALYDAWARRHPERAGRASRAVDVKAAIIKEFRERGTILIATEAAAEGVNLQFCSLVVNYDLPWNPQRVEQRIGRCHRYGQEHDVVVVNFLNKRNEADQRVLQLLSEKFQLFSGVFGASDDVLGALESGVDIERRIAQLYQTCRTAAEIDAAFDALQAELDEQIQGRMEATRQSVLEHFDEEVHERLEVHRDQALATLDERQRWLLSLARAELGTDAIFEPDEPRFHYSGPLGPRGSYHLDWRVAEANGDYFYRVDSPLATTLIERAIERALPMAELAFDYRLHGANVAALQPFRGGAGWLELAKLSVTALDTEEYLVASATADDGRVLDHEQCVKLLNLPAHLAGTLAASEPPVRLQAGIERETAVRLQEVETRNAAYVEEEIAKLDRWADDLKFGLERELREIETEIRDARRDARAGTSLTDKLASQKRLRDLESKRNAKRRDLFAAQDTIDAERDTLISGIEQQLQQTHDLTPLFRVRWSLA